MSYKCLNASTTFIVRSVVACMDGGRCEPSVRSARRSAHLVTWLENIFLVFRTISLWRRLVPVRPQKDGHLTDVPVDSVYSGVVSLRDLRLIIFLGEHNALEIWATDIGNAYLEAKTKEMLYIIAGPEFGTLEGHVLVIYKALYGLSTGDLCWHERLSDFLSQEGFKPCKAEPDIWMRPNGDAHEYIAVYVDDLTFAMRDTHAFVTVLQDKHHFNYIWLIFH